MAGGIGKEREGTGGFPLMAWIRDLPGRVGKGDASIIEYY